MVGGPPAGAGDAGSGPGPGGSRMPWSGWGCVPRLLGPVCLEPVLHYKRGRRDGRPRHRDEDNSSWSRVHAQRRRPNAAKNKLNLKKKKKKKLNKK